MQNGKRQKKKHKQYINQATYDMQQTVNINQQVRTERYWYAFIWITFSIGLIILKQKDVAIAHVTMDSVFLLTKLFEH